MRSPKPDRHRKQNALTAHSPTNRTPPPPHRPKYQSKVADDEPKLLWPDQVPDSMGPRLIKNSFNNDSDFSRPRILANSMCGRRPNTLRCRCGSIFPSAPQQTQRFPALVVCSNLHSPQCGGTAHVTPSESAIENSSTCNDWFDASQAPIAANKLAHSCVPNCSASFLTMAFTILKASPLRMGIRQSPCHRDVAQRFSPTNSLSNSSVRFFDSASRTPVPPAFHLRVHE